MHMRHTKKFVFDSAAKRATHIPLRTATELAEELGVARAAMVRQMNADPTGPRARVDHKGTAANAWYDPSEVRAWWRKRKEQGASK